MMANTTHDSAGMPWNRVRIGERKLSTARERTISNASAAPTANAPARPAKILKIVASTSANIAPEEKISRQRQNTSISDGNRNRGKNSEANCHSAITTTNGRIDKANRRKADNSRSVGEGGPEPGTAWLIGPAPDRSSKPPDPKAGTRSTFRRHRPS